MSANVIRQGPMGRKRRWLAEDDTLLQELYPNTPVSDIAWRLGRDPGAIYQRAARFGLHKNGHKSGEAYHAIAQMPGFVESLRLLIEREQYSLTDIGLMFGVSCERIRQLANRYVVNYRGDWSRGLNAVRVWDDAANRFRPVGKTELACSRRRAKGAQRKAHQLRRITETQARIVDAIASLRARLNREPTWREMYIAAGGDGNIAYHNSAARLLSMWDTRNGLYHRTADKLREFREATGTASRGRGGAAHVHRRGYSPICRKGHLKKVHPSGQRWCPTCRAESYHRKNYHRKYHLGDEIMLNTKGESYPACKEASAGDSWQNPEAPEISSVTESKVTGENPRTAPAAEVPPPEVPPVGGAQ